MSGRSDPIRVQTSTGHRIHASNQKTAATIRTNGSAATKMPAGTMRLISEISLTQVLMCVQLLLVKMPTRVICLASVTMSRSQRSLKAKAEPNSDLSCTLDVQSW